MKGVVSGVRDYGNRMGIPTVNGAIYFDRRYLGNPLVYCGNVGLIPRDKSFKQPQAGDHIVALGGPHRPRRHPRRHVQFGRTDQPERKPLGRSRADRQRDHRKNGARRAARRPRPRAVQRRDRLRRRRIFQRRRRDGRRDRGRSLARQGAGQIRRALVHRNLDFRSPGADGPVGAARDAGPSWRALCESEGVEATVIGRFVPTGRLRAQIRRSTRWPIWTCGSCTTAGPPVVREAVYQPPPPRPFAWPTTPLDPADLTTRRGFSARSTWPASIG